jgi:hypothetical protein
MKIDYTFRLSAALNAATGDYSSECRRLFVGFKNSLEALSRYDIYVNSNKIYSQAWVGPESFIYNAGLHETVAERSPYVHTCSKNVHNMSPDVCGVYIDLTAGSYAPNTDITVQIPVKINLNQILMLASLRYLPSFCGRWELELYPNWNNVVVMPVDPECNIGAWKYGQICANTAWKDVTKTFTQIGAPFSMISLVKYGIATSGVTKQRGIALTPAGSAPYVKKTNAALYFPTTSSNAEAHDFNYSNSDTGSGTVTNLTINPTKEQYLLQVNQDTVVNDGVDFVTNVVIDQAAADVSNVTETLTCIEGTLQECLMSITTFQLRFEVFEDLRRMYSEQPLIIPTNILHYSRFSGQPGSNTVDTDFHATLSQSLENCDSVFILVPFNTAQTTCFYQPWLRSMRLSLGEFGIHPSRYVKTYDDPHFLAMVLDSLNLETSEITAMNKDVARSITSPRSAFKWNGTKMAPDWTFTEGDASNFFIGVSLSQVGFQSGTVSSPNTNIPFIFDAALDNPPLKSARGDEIRIDTSIICMFLLDCAIMIQVVPNSDIPVVKLTNKSIV